MKILSARRTISPVARLLLANPELHSDLALTGAGI